MLTRGSPEPTPTQRVGQGPWWFPATGLCGGSVPAAGGTGPVSRVPDHARPDRHCPLPVRASAPRTPAPGGRPPGRSRWRDCGRSTCRRWSGCRRARWPNAKGGGEWPRGPHPHAGAQGRRQTVDGPLRDRVVAECRQKEQEVGMGVGSGPAGSCAVRGRDQFRPGQAGPHEVPVVPCDQIGLVPVRVMDEVFDALLSGRVKAGQRRAPTAAAGSSDGRPTGDPGPTAARPRRPERRRRGVRARTASGRAARGGGRRGRRGGPVCGRGACRRCRSHRSSCRAARPPAARGPRPAAPPPVTAGVRSPPPFPRRSRRRPRAR
jgi:hypothetical protein